jgi:hypothetical protein
MAIIVDPDNADRNQIIFGSENQLISIYPVGTLIDLNSSGTTGVTTGSTTSFSDVDQTFISDGVAAGDILCLFDGVDAAHYVIDSVPEEGRVLVTSASFDGHNTKFSVDSTQQFTGDTGIIYQIREPSGGSVEDGITKQALYSFGKEEWRVDSNVGSLTGYTDDLIRHEFPYEPITSEQFEIGGGAAHDDWSYFNDYTRKKIRTGGWADLHRASDTLEEWTGIITLGSLDSDTQVYYQPLSASADPVDFDFLGAVNESIEVLSGTYDTRTYLKLFARKKARFYDQSELNDIGVTTIQTIVNRFPLAHAEDPAISSTDAEISGSSPYRQTNELSTNTNGVTADVDTNTGTLTSAGSTFQTDGVVAGDVLEIAGVGSDAGFYTIIIVDSETQLTVDTSELGGFTGDTGLTFTVDTIFIIRPDNSDENNVIGNLTDATGYLSSSTGQFFTNAIEPNDIVLILSSTSKVPTFESEFVGAYKVVTASSETQLVLNTQDKQFPDTGDLITSASVHYAVVEPGMFLQRKEEPVSGSSGLAPGFFDTGNLTFANADPDTITRASGDWSTDGVTSGSVVVITDTTSNNGSFTVASVAPTVLTLISTDTLTAEGPVSGSVVAFDAFKRDINGVFYAFRWRLFGNSALLSSQYQFVQHQLRQPADIDFGGGVSMSGSGLPGLPEIARGDVTDLLMQFSTPTATLFDTYIDDLDATDTNNATFRDSTGVDRIFAFVSVGSLQFNSNLQNDASAEYWMFFTSVPSGDYGTPDAIIVDDADGIDISGSVGGAPSVQFTFDYDNNTQGGRTAATDAPITVVAIGLSTAQFIITTSTIERSKANNVSLVAALERVYSNP